MKIQEVAAVVRVNRWGLTWKTVTKFSWLETFGSSLSLYIYIYIYIYYELDDPISFGFVWSIVDYAVPALACTKIRGSGDLAHLNLIFLLFGSISS